MVIKITNLENKDIRDLDESEGQQITGGFNIGSFFSQLLGLLLGDNTDNENERPPVPDSSGTR